ncbi:MAG: ROK family protein [Armatimonadota bacterium]
MNSQRENVLGIDIGGTKSIVGIADRAGTLLAHKRVSTPNALGPDANLNTILAASHQVIGESGGQIKAIGIGCGGPLDRKSGVLHKVANLPGWEGICLTKLFQNEFGAPAFLDNDATAAALGEARYGAGKRFDDFIYLTVSTGIGGGIIIGGQPYRGRGENAGEIGHTKIIPDGPPCKCGDRGCLEALSSGTAIARIAKEGLPSHPDSSLNNLKDPLTAEAVAKAAKNGDSYAAEVWQDAMYHLGIGIANVVNILNPQAVIIGGGVANAGEMLFEPVTKTVKQRAMKVLAADVEILPSAHGDLIGVVGAVAIAWEGLLAAPQAP